MINNAQFTYVYVFLSACIIENLVFARGAGVASIIERTKTDRFILTYGIVMTIIATPAVILTWFVNYFINNVVIWNKYRGLIAITALALAFFLVRLLFSKDAKDTNKSKLKFLDETMTLAAFGTSALATVLLSVSSHPKLLSAVVYSFGCGAGLTISMLLIHSGRERIEISKVHKSFQGLPIIMIYIGILSLAVYGLTGHLLPA